ncbi:hypothetical protein PCE1_002840 [Barthelona sp. PCE]
MSDFESEVEADIGGYTDQETEDELYTIDEGHITQNDIDLVFSRVDSLVSELPNLLFIQSTVEERDTQIEKIRMMTLTQTNVLDSTSQTQIRKYKISKKESLRAFVDNEYAIALNHIQRAIQLKPRYEEGWKILDDIISRIKKTNSSDSKILLDTWIQVRVTICKANMSFPSIFFAELIDELIKNNLFDYEKHSLIIDRGITHKTGRDDRSKNMYAKFRCHELRIEHYIENKKKGILNTYDRKKLRLDIARSVTFNPNDHDWLMKCLDYCHIIDSPELISNLLGNSIDQYLKMAAEWVTVYPLVTRYAKAKNGEILYKNGIQEKRTLADRQRELHKVLEGSVIEAALYAYSKGRYSFAADLDMENANLFSYSESIFMLNIIEYLDNVIITNKLDMHKGRINALSKHVSRHEGDGTPLTSVFHNADLYNIMRAIQDIQKHKSETSLSRTSNLHNFQSHFSNNVPQYSLTDAENRKANLEARIMLELIHCFEFDSDKVWFLIEMRDYLEGYYQTLNREAQIPMYAFLFEFFKAVDRNNLHEFQAFDEFMELHDIFLPQKAITTFMSKARWTSLDITTVQRRHAPRIVEGLYDLLNFHVGTIFASGFKGWFEYLQLLTVVFDVMGRFKSSFEDESRIFNEINNECIEFFKNIRYDTLYDAIRACVSQKVFIIVEKAFKSDKKIFGEFTSLLEDEFLFNAIWPIFEDYLTRGRGFVTRCCKFLYHSQQNSANFLNFNGYMSMALIFFNTQHRTLKHPQFVTFIADSLSKLKRIIATSHFKDDFPIILSSLTFFDFSHNRDVLDLPKTMAEIIDKNDLLIYLTIFMNSVSSLNYQTRIQSITTTLLSYDENGPLSLSMSSTMRDLQLTQEYVVCLLMLGIFHSMDALTKVKPTTPLNMTHAFAYFNRAQEINERYLSHMEHIHSLYQITIYFNIAKFYELMGEFSRAVVVYQDVDDMLENEKGKFFSQWYSFYKKRVKKCQIQVFTELERFDEAGAIFKEFFTI